MAESGRATSLVVHLKQRSYVAPWGLFLYAEGTDAEVRVTLHTHVVVVQGAGLSSLLLGSFLAGCLLESVFALAKLAASEQTPSFITNALVTSLHLACPQKTTSLPAHGPPAACYTGRSIEFSRHMLIPLT